MSLATTDAPASTPSSTPTSDLFGKIQKELDLQRSLLTDYKKNLEKKWLRQTSREPSRFINQDGKLNIEALKNFRRFQFFIPDTPSTDYSRFSLRNTLDGVRRGEKKMLIEAYDRLERLGHLPLLKKYPSPSIGNPNLFHWKGYTYTWRWHKHMHFIGLVNTFLRDRLSSQFIGLDLGSSYGIFPSLLKKEFPQSHHVLVDFPEQLLLAYYYLSEYIPGAKIAGLSEIKDQATLPRSFIEQYDFVLVPVTLYSKLAPGSVDLYSNFASLGEMNRQWFQFYMDSEVFRTARYFFTANRYDSVPTYETDVAIIDYPVWNPSKRIHFATSPVFSHNYYARRKLFFYEKRMFPQSFEYIGEI